MVSAADLRKWFKAAFELPSVTSGKLDTSKKETAALYLGLFSTGDSEKLKQDRGYYMKAVRCLMRCDVIGDEASDKADALYEKLRLHTGQIAGSEGFITLKEPQPVSLGTDDAGVFEYSIDFTITLEEGEP